MTYKALQSLLLPSSWVPGHKFHSHWLPSASLNMLCAVPDAFSSLHDFCLLIILSSIQMLSEGPFLTPKNLQLLCLFIDLHIYFQLELNSLRTGALSVLFIIISPALGTVLGTWEVFNKYLPNGYKLFSEQFVVR